jgi:hypothetical protein
MKSLLKQKFTSPQHKTKFKFPHVLFAKEMRLLATHKFSTVKTVYGDHTDKALKKAYKAKDAHTQSKKDRIKHEKFMMDQPIDPSELLAYTVPIKQTKQGLQVNWTLIDRLVDYIKGRLEELILPTDRHLIVEKYDLEEVAKKNRN